MAIEIDPKKSFEDYIREVNDELSRVEENYHLLAHEMVYEGNSVQWWQSKATAYRKAIEDVWTILGKYGVKADGKTSVVEALDNFLSKP